MILGAKHQDQQVVARANFSGGLNTSSTLDGIAENQLSYAVNVEIDSASGRLKTVSGTVDVLNFPNIFAAVYDEINKSLLLVNNSREVFLANLVGGVIGAKLGELSGTMYPICALWENGILIASGGKLQYYNGNALSTISTSPNATSVYSRSGRVVAITNGDAVRYSGIGDETNWTEDTNDNSSSKFIELGYKDGGALAGALNMPNCLLFVKNNRRLYSLVGEFPNWAVGEISCNAEVKNRLGMCSVADSAFLLCNDELQSIQPNAAYGETKPVNVGELVMSELQALSATAKLRFIPPLKQLWCIDGITVLMFDLVRNAWFKRTFNSAVVDAIPIGNDVMIIKQDRVSKLDTRSFSDVGQPLHWGFRAQSLVSLYDFLLKHTRVSFTPIDTRFSVGQISAGAVVVDLPAAESTDSKIRLIQDENTNSAQLAVLAENRNTYRSKCLHIKGNGYGTGMFLNSIILTLAEV